MPRAWVVVLGDVGRSPRMQYHTSSLCKTVREDGYVVNLIGYRGADLIPDLQRQLSSGALTLSYIPDLPIFVRHLPRPVALPLKAFLQLIVLLWMMLISLPRPDVILLQLPPALPTMIVCWLAARRHVARLVYDWHNFAYTLMALTMGRDHLLVNLSEKYERYWGKKADGGLCVTRAMQMELRNGWNIETEAFHDRPPDFFRPSTVPEQHDLFTRLSSTMKEPMHPRDFAAELAQKIDASTNGAGTLRTERVGDFRNGGIVLRADRPAVVVTSTSWTPDEDFGILLAAAEIYDGAAADCAPGGFALPRLLIFVTGLGPQRAEFEARMHELDLCYVSFRTVWLEPKDYPVLLGSADLGISLHASSSNLDLPMKVVDMFGCALPVCALSYSCIEELVKDGHNGLLFSTPSELADGLATALRGFPAAGVDREGAGVLARLKRGAEASSRARWHENWKKTALPVIRGSSSASKQRSKR